jgi:transcriptional regulator with XRE-family HTH domain
MIVCPMEKIHDIIKEKRQTLGLTQKDFAALIGSTRGSIAKYETEGAVPPGNILLKILNIKEGTCSKKESMS